MKLLTYLLLALSLTHCASQQVKMSHVQKGMTQDQVLEIMGTPEDRTFRGGQETWLYKSHGQNKVIAFEGGKVTELVNTDDAKSSLHGATTGKKEGLCAGSNSYGKFAEGGGCNMYGCWPKGGYCNGFGCSASGFCTNAGCPKKIDSYSCLD